MQSDLGTLIAAAICASNQRLVEQLTAGRVSPPGTLRSAQCMPAVPETRARVHIDIDVHADGRLGIVLWRGNERNASYALVYKQRALAKCLPQAIDEAIEFAQSGPDAALTE